ncbi:hypothetical protein WICMUC_004542 [Wickerhamomyces mucosus]|uniref:Uncharacterized protein n=1 Tax=Wickerhamomyces mucosus TaxID=1378264 RepID=A0A9P8PI40_9ASCO|nr:hypothetical protein WICMUC_004542 [Wickerhamomyces mucosus]
MTDNNDNLKRFGQFKLVLLGDSAVGKSSIVTRFVKNSFDEYRESTIGAAFITKTLDLDSLTVVKFEIWDTAGQERYKSLAPMYYRNAQVALVVFDLTDLESFKKSQKWIEELKIQGGDDLIIKLVGNKLDLQDDVKFNIIDDDIVNEYLSILENNSKNSNKNIDGTSMKVEYIKTSAKSGENISKLFQLIAEDLPVEKFKVQTDEYSSTREGIINLNQLKNNYNSSSCNC